MKFISILLGSALLVLATASCATTYMTPTNVLWYAQGSTASSATSYDPGVKRGRACATSYLGLFATGDASIRAAADDAGIKNVQNVSHEVKSIMGFFGDVCTVVRGT